MTRFSERMTELTKINIELTPTERRTLADHNFREQSAFAFWQEVLRTRKIVIPADKVYRIERAVNAQYFLTTENKKLGPNARAAVGNYANRFPVKQSFELVVPPHRYPPQTRKETSRHVR